MKRLFLLILFAACASADDKPAVKKIECPRAIFVTPKEELVTGGSDGWNPRTEPIRHELAGATLYDGRPEEKASLVPDKQATQGTRAIWNLSKENKNGYWLECRYAQAAIVISKRVPDESIKCIWSGNRKEETVSCD